MGVYSFFRRSASLWTVTRDGAVFIELWIVPFKKGYLPSWTRELFKVVNIFPTDPTTYRIVDYDGEAIKGKFYAEELQVVKENDVFKVEKVIKTRRRHGKVEYLVRWLGYPPKFDSWVSELIWAGGRFVASNTPSRKSYSAVKSFWFISLSLPASWIYLFLETVSVSGPPFWVGV